MASPQGAPKKTPVTMLSGFLGAGKTTLLRYVLENSGEKIACIVNDVASINIDAKLVRNDRNRARTEGQAAASPADLADTIELANGCACCNLQDELFASFEQVLALADKRGEPYARIVLENSGVAEPQSIRDKFNEAAAEGHPLLQRIEMDTMVTVVDAGTFVADYASKAPLSNRPDLGDGGNLRPVVDLLVEQIECADFIVVNKTDMLPDAAEQDKLLAIMASLNPLATVIPVTQGEIPIDKVFGSSAHAVVAKLNIEGQHRGAVAAVKALEQKEHSHDHKEHSGHDHGHDHHDHKHDHDHDHHDHDHDHDHKHVHGPECADVCTHSHDHKEHSHDHEHKEHKHSHGEDGHKHDGCEACDHDHAHDHDHGHGDKHEHHHHHHKAAEETRAAQRFGIRSFVYSRRRPFHPQRLREMVLRWLPVTHNQALEGELPGLGDSPIKTVLRSKGFMWMSNSHSTAYYWSHAGQHFEVRDEGDWWAAVAEDGWPTDPAQRTIILQDFDLSGPYGDRRQEIVFIGVGMSEQQISEQLDSALLTEEEMAKYSARWAATPDPPHALAAKSAAGAAAH